MSAIDIEKDFLETSVKIQTTEIEMLHLQNEIDSIEKSNGSDCTYDYESIYGKGWNASHEVNLCLNNGYREVHAGKETELELGGEQK